MNGILLSLHVLAAILLVGPITVATSLFPRYARATLQSGADGIRAQGVVLALHRVTRGYSVVALLVPAIGFALAVSMRVVGQLWILAAIVITIAAAGLLGGAVLPAQRRLLAVIGDYDPASAMRFEGGAAARAASKRLAMVTGWFALAWVAVVVLMVVRPGSSTGVGL